ncbi:MAG: hypothetical protein IPO78_17370 [Saprospiraceae bacterium]|nr:hypothetical protein [Saprospiraceae bacterium]
MQEDYQVMPKPVYDFNIVSNSLLSKFKDWLDGKPEQEEKPASYRIGNLFDALITDGDKLDLFNRKYVGYNDEIFTFTETEYYTLKGMEKSFLNFIENTQWKNLLPFWKFQQRFVAPYIVNSEITFNLKSIYDISIIGKVGIDLKTTKAKSLNAFIKACEYFDYDRGRYLYTQSSGIEKDYIIGICSLPPYNVYIIDSVKQGWMETGKRKMDALLVQYYYYFC